MNNPAIEALKEAKAVLEFLHPLIKVAGVPPMSRKIGVMCGIATSGAHKIKHVLPIIDAALTPAPAVDASTAEHLRKLVYAAKWATTQGFEATIKDVEYLEQKLKAALSAVDVPADKRIIRPEDWPEDFAHENGNYLCTCLECDVHFTGHKRRKVCKVCAPPAPTTKPQPQNDPNLSCPIPGLEEALKKARHPGHRLNVLMHPQDKHYFLTILAAAEREAQRNG